MRLKRCGLKGIALLYFVYHKNLMYIQTFFVGILHGSTKHIATLTFIIYRECKIMIIYALPTNKVWQGSKIHRIFKTINQ